MGPSQDHTGCVPKKQVIAVCLTKIRKGKTITPPHTKHKNTPQHHTYQNNVLVRPSKILNLLARLCILHYPPSSGDPMGGYSLFPCALSSAIGFCKQWHQGKGIVIKQEVVQIWSSPQGFRTEAPRCHP